MKRLITGIVFVAAAASAVLAYFTNKNKVEETRIEDNENVVSNEISNTVENTVQTNISNLVTNTVR